MNEKYLNFLKKSWKIIVAVLFALAVILGLLQREPNQYSLQNKSAESGGTADEFWAFYNKARELAPPKPEQKTSASFLAVGDIMLSRNVAQKIKDAGDPLLPFLPFASVFQSVDFSFGNLESPFSGRNDFNSTGSLIFNAPKENIKGLVENKFKVLSLANNHALDQAETGLEYTIKYLDENNIKHIGAGLTMDSAWAPAVVEQNNIKICFIGASYASLNDGGKTTNDYVARIENVEKLKSSILNLKSACDFIVASMHAGTEYVTKPNQDQVNFAHAAIDAGADMVIGHHPHWVQTLERYCPNTATSPWPSPQKEREGLQSAIPSPNEGRVPEGRERLQCANPKYIFYSLGNFIFDQMWSQETREGLVLKIRVSKQQESNLQGSRTSAALDSIELIPVIIENYSTPRPADEKETKKLLERIGQTTTLLYP